MGGKEKHKKKHKRRGTTSTIVNIYHQSINIYFPDMIDIQEFIKNLQTVNPLTPVQTQGLMVSYQQSLQQYSVVLSDTLQENCYQQMIDRKISCPPKRLPIVAEMDINNKKDLDVAKCSGLHSCVSNNKITVANPIGNVVNNMVKDYYDGWEGRSGGVGKKSLTPVTSNLSNNLNNLMLSAQTIIIRF